VLNPMEAKAWVRGVRNRSPVSNLAPNGPDWEGFALGLLQSVRLHCLSSRVPE